MKFGVRLHRIEILNISGARIYSCIDILNLEYEFGWSKIKCFFRWVFFVVKDLLLPSKNKNIPTLTTTYNVPVYLYTGQHRISVIHIIYFLHPPTQTFMIPAGHSGNAPLSEDKQLPPNGKHQLPTNSPASLLTTQAVQPHDITHTINMPSVLNQANIRGKQANSFGWEMNSKRMRAGSEV